MDRIVTLTSSDMQAIDVLCEATGKSKRELEKTYDLERGSLSQIDSFSNKLNVTFLKKLIDNLEVSVEGQIAAGEFQSKVQAKVRSTIELLRRKFLAAEHSWDFSFLDSLQYEINSLENLDYSLEDEGFVDNPARDESKREQVVKIQVELTQLIVELRQTNSPEYVDLREALISLLRTLLVLLGDDGETPPAKIPGDVAKKAKGLSDHLKDVEQNTTAVKKTYESTATVVGGLLKLMGLG